VVQEICFAREVVAQYGQYTIPWSEVECMVKRYLSPRLFRCKVHTVGGTLGTEADASRRHLERSSRALSRGVSNEFGPYDVRFKNSAALGPSR
jgi:hypothetical protein